MLSLQPVHYPPDERIASAHVCERLSIRTTARLFDMAYNTLAGWPGKKAEIAPALEDTLVLWQNGDVLELNELWSFVGVKAQACWMWVALCQITRQAVAYNLYDRSEHSARWFYKGVPLDQRQAAARSDH